MPNNERPRIIDQQPPIISPQEQTQLSLELIKLRQKIESNDSGREQIVVLIPSRDSMMGIILNDTHIGSIFTDYDSIEEMRDFGLENDSVFFIGAGDYVEGIKGEYLNTNVTKTPINLQQQIELTRQYLLEPLASQGKILSMTSDYWGHDGWSSDATTINPWKVLTDGLNVPLLRNNGGRLIVQFENGQSVTYEIYHNPPGSSRIDPVHGLREAVLPTSESMRADVYVNAHTHQMAVAKENYAGAKKSVVLISSGTPKGSSSEVPPDTFGVKLPRKRADESGQGAVVTVSPDSKRTSNKPLILPYPSLKHGEAINSMTEVYNALEHQGLTKEITERIRAEVEAKPEIKLNHRSSKLVIGQHDESPKEPLKAEDEPRLPYKLAPQYETLGYNISSVLPKIIVPIGRVRIGAATEGYKDLKSFLKEYANNPDILYTFLGNMIDKDVPTSPYRMSVLDRYAAIIPRDKALLVMFDGILRDGRWKKSLTKFDPPIPAGTYLYDKTSIPLIANFSHLNLTIGPKNARVMDKPTYTGVLVDHLGGNGSFDKPTFGHKRIYSRRLHEKPGFVLGGHMPNSGFMYFPDTSNAETHTPFVMANGGFAKQDNTNGNSNIWPVSEPGQGIILMPGTSKDDYLAIAVANRTDLAYLAPAAFLYVGSKHLGLSLKDFISK